MLHRMSVLVKCDTWFAPIEAIKHKSSGRSGRGNGE